MCSRLVLVHGPTLLLSTPDNGGIIVSPRCCHQRLVLSRGSNCRVSNSRVYIKDDDEGWDGLMGVLLTRKGQNKDFNLRILGRNKPKLLEHCVKAIGTLRDCKTTADQPRLKERVEPPWVARQWNLWRGKGEWERVTMYWSECDEQLGNAEQQQQKKRLKSSSSSSSSPHNAAAFPPLISPGALAAEGNPVTMTVFETSASGSIGKFSPEAAIKLGVPKGPMFGLLANGQDVTLEDGSVVKSDQVTLQRSRPVKLIVLDSHVRRRGSLWPEREDSFSAPLPLRLANLDGFDLDLVVHKFSSDSDPDESYWEQVKSALSHFKAAKHIVICYGIHGQCSKDTALVAEKLSMISPCFLSPNDSPASATSAHALACKGMGIVEGAVKCGLKAVLGKDNVTYQFFPRNKRGWVDDENSKSSELIREGATPSASSRTSILTPSDVREIADDLKSAGVHADVPKPPNFVNALSCVPELSFLGTGSSMPAKERNVSSVFVTTSPSDLSGMLLDVGEGTLGQIFQLYGDEAADNYLSRVKAIWISHGHADHHLGLSEIIRYRVSRGFKKLLVIAPASVMSLVKGIQHHIWPELSAGYIEVNCSHFVENFVPDGMDRQALEDGKYLLRDIGVSKLEAVPVDHCSDSYGLVMETSACWGKLVYSGDCRPSKALIAAGRGAKTVVHEATFEADMWEDAYVKKHSTITEAIDVGIECEAEYIVLTHFSQRYPQMPVVEAGRVTDNGVVIDKDGGVKSRRRVVVAWDWMRLTESNICSASALVPKLRVAFPKVEQSGSNHSQTLVDGKSSKEFLNTPGSFAYASGRCNME